MELCNDGGVPVPGPFAARTYPWTLSAGDGVKRVTARFWDISGTVSPTVADTITLDTHGPSTRVPAPVTVATGGSFTLQYRVDDNLSPRADAVIRVKNGDGARVKTDTALTCPIVCALAPGDYQIRVSAIDYAGNPQQHTGYNKLTVVP
jgi:hypothetical protein